MGMRRCSFRKLSLACLLLCRRQLVAHKEESTEMGGYFICNGIERIIRMLIVQRRHYMMGLKRSAYKKRGNNYTETATLLRSALCDVWPVPGGLWGLPHPGPPRPEGTAPATLTLHESQLDQLTLRCSSRSWHQHVPHAFLFRLLA